MRMGLLVASSTLNLIYFSQCVKYRYALAIHFLLTKISGETAAVEDATRETTRQSKRMQIFKFLTPKRIKEVNVYE